MKRQEVSNLIKLIQSKDETDYKLGVTIFEKAKLSNQQVTVIRKAIDNAEDYHQRKTTLYPFKNK